MATVDGRSTEKLRSTTMKERPNIFSILLDAICCVMCANGKMSRREQKTIHAILKKVKCPWTANDVGNQTANFLQRVEETGLDTITDETCEKLSEFRRRGKEYVLLKCIDYMVNADGIVDEKEMEVCGKFKSALTDEPSPRAAKAGSNSQIPVADPVSVQNPKQTQEDAGQAGSWPERKAIPDEPGKEDVAPCSFCKGSGLCSGCSGTGKREVAGMIAFDKPRTDRPKEPCFICVGSGICNMCDGRGER